MTLDQSESGESITRTWVTRTTSREVPLQQSRDSQLEGAAGGGRGGIDGKYNGKVEKSHLLYQNKIILLYQYFLPVF